MIKSSISQGTDEFLESKLIQDLLEFSETYYKDALGEAYEFFWDEFDPEESNDDEILKFCDTNFMEWFIYDWLINEEAGLTIIDIFMKENTNLTQDELDVLKMMRDAYISLYEVQEVFPEQGLLLKDLFSNEEYMVREKLATRNVQKWDIFSTRLLYLDNKYIMSGCVYPYPLNQKENIIKHINRCYQDYKKEFPSTTFKQYLKINGNIFNDVWCHIAKNPPQVKLVTTDKEPLIFSKAIYDITDNKAVINKLTNAKELTKTKHNEFLWLNKKDTVLARIEVNDKQLLLECNSKERLEKSKAIINKYIANMITHKSDEFKDPLQAIQSMKDLPIEKMTDKIPYEIEQKLYKDYMQRYYEKWLNEPIPALSGKTPFEAIKTEKGKQKVINLLKNLENTQEHNKKEGRPYFDTSWLWEKLNIPRED